MANPPDKLADELVAYSVAVRIDTSGQSRRRVADAAGVDAATLSHTLKGSRSFAPSTLAHIDAVLSSSTASGLHRGRPASVRRLAEYQQEVLTELGLREAHEMVADLAAASYLYHELVAMPPRTNADVILEAHTLAALLVGSRRRGNSEADLPGGWSLVTNARRTLDRLLTVMVSPFGSTGAAAHLLASLAGVLPQLTADRISAFAYGSPLGFQSVRALSMILARYPKGTHPHDCAWTATHLLVSSPPPDPYPSRGYLVDALQHALPTHPEAAALLEQIALDPGYSKRPRAAAAYYLHRSDPALGRSLLDQFAASSDGLLQFHASLLLDTTSPDVRDQTDGLLAAVEWHLTDCLRSADIPPSVSDATRLLLREALTNVDVRHRRLFLNALMSGGIGARVASFFRSVLADSNLSVWIRAEAAWCLGHLRDGGSVSDLIARAARSPLSSPEPMIIRHHALWAIGEIQQPDTDIRSLTPLCLAVDEPQTEVRRAAIFALAALREPTGSLALARARTDMDSLCGAFARWGLELLSARRDAEAAQHLKPLSIRSDLNPLRRPQGSGQVDPPGGLWEHP